MYEQFSLNAAETWQQSEAKKSEDYTFSYTLFGYRAATNTF
jgi:hypothetical protein